MKKFFHRSYRRFEQIDEALAGCSSLIELFDKVFHKHGDKPAFSSLGETLKFSELDVLSLRFAAFLQSKAGLLPGDRIVIQLPNIMQFPIAFYGCIRAGLVVVTANPASTPCEIEHQFNDSGAKALIVLANDAKAAQDVLPNTKIETVIVTDYGDMLPGLKRFIVNNSEKYLRKNVPDYQFENSYTFLNALAIGSRRLYSKPQVGAKNIVTLQYTGGTTGVSRGVMLTHQNILANVAQIKVRLSTDVDEGDETVVNPLPFYHIYPLMMSCGVFFEMGCHTILIADLNDLDKFVAELSKWRFTVLLGIDSLLARLCNHEDFRKSDFSSLKLTTAGGSALTNPTARRWRKLTGGEITEGYGMSETSAVVTINPVGGSQLGTVGIPLLRTEVKVVDEDGAMLSFGKAGELCVRGPQIMAGYWLRPEETQNVLSADNWLRTGDIAMIQNDGYLRIIDRKNDMIQVAGFKVYPNEIEEIICAHPDISECAAIGVAEEKGGQSIKVFVVSSDQQLTEESLREFCRERLTAYKVPKFIEFLPSLPKSNIGKLLRRELTEDTVKSANRAA